MPTASDTMTVADKTSQEFLGRWQRLISTSNWEKGRIIHDWRQALIKAKADVTEYSDEAWSVRVSQVSSQHVGRLRRSYERFGMVYQEYAGLYWSHFQAALEWHDAEMWLEGAVQNEWSVAAMRRERATAYGQVEDEATATRETTEQTSEWDEDAPTESNDLSRGNSATQFDMSGPAHEGPDFGDESSTGTAVLSGPEVAAEVTPDLRPFAELPTLPEDLANSLEEVKLAILRHKVTNWQAVQPSEIIAHLEALKQMVRGGSVE